VLPLRIKIPVPFSNITFPRLQGIDAVKLIGVLRGILCFSFARYSAAILSPT
jgi:hypothetical protein